MIESFTKHCQTLLYSIRTHVHDENLVCIPGGAVLVSRKMSCAGVQIHLWVTMTSTPAIIEYLTASVHSCATTNKLFEK